MRMPTARGALRWALGIAVVVTTYQQEAYLSDALRSVTREEPDECVVVDDGSDVPVDDIVGQFPGVRLHRQANAGVSAARNAGLALTSSPYVVFLDADDRLLPGALTTGARSLDAHPDAAFTSGASRLITADGSPLGVTLPQPRTADLYERLLARPYICPPSVVTFRRTALDTVGGWTNDPEIWGVEDWDLTLRLARVWPIVCHGELVAEYRMHGTQSSTRTDRMRASIETLLGREAEFTRGDSRHERARRAGLRYWRTRTSYELAVRRMAAARDEGSTAEWLSAAASRAWWFGPAAAYRAPTLGPVLAARDLIGSARSRPSVGTPPTWSRQRVTTLVGTAAQDPPVSNGTDGSDADAGTAADPITRVAACEPSS